MQLSLFKIVVNSLMFLIFAYLFPQGLSVTSWVAAAAAALTLALANQFVKPLIQLISLPITILTLGLFSIVINALMLGIADSVVNGFSIKSFGWNIAIAVFLSIGNAWLNAGSKTKLY